MKLQKYDDGGHGWLRVRRETLRLLGILTKISHYSYERGEFVYVEEDADMALLHKALEAKGETLTYRTNTTDKRSKIRSYASFRINIRDCT